MKNIPIHGTNPRRFIPLDDVVIEMINRSLDRGEMVVESGGGTMIDRTYRRDAIGDLICYEVDRRLQAMAGGWPMGPVTPEPPQPDAWALVAAQCGLYPSLTDVSTPAKWKAAQLAAATDLLARLKKMREALTKIASYGEGANVTGAFDEPNAAKIAREAL